MGDTREAGALVLELRELVKRYGRVEALVGLDLGVREGEVYGLLGRNGAGKSTAIRIIMGITRATSGQARVFGAEVGRSVKYREQVGYVAQEQAFYGWMSPERLGRFLCGFYPTWDDGEYVRLLERLELPPRRKVATFSGGMKVKLALALALAHRPRLLVLDEPTAGLDPVARREFLELIRAQAEASGRTTFFSTHLVDEVEYAADRIGVVDGGRARFEGTVPALLARVRRFRHPEAESVSAPPLATLEAPGVRVLRDEVSAGERRLVVEAEEEALLAAPAEAGWIAEPLTLEEAFIELVGQRAAALFWSREGR